MTLNKLASAIAKREGKKHQASIGDVREILRILCDLEFESRMQFDLRSPAYLISTLADKRLHRTLAKEKAKPRTYVRMKRSRAKAAASRARARGKK